MYQALYRKYRPQTFDEVAGQTAVTQTLRNQIITGKLSHAYLFTGSRGTGKTTCAKILAKAVNCLNPADGNPCGVCSACRGIDSGSVLDVQEIDAASNNGVDNVRSIRDEAVYPPAEVKKRVYIIDEVHMLSMAAFNALLKTLEEPPEHLMFILATTEQAKVPATILSRCQRFAFRRPTAEDITGNIRYVAYQEGIQLEPDAAELLGRLANGAFRDGLSLLDQCASASGGTVSVESIYQTLGLAGQQQTMALMNAVADQDTARTLELFSELYAAGKDAASLLNELSTLARDLLIVKTAPKSGIGLISTICTGKEAAQLSPRFTPEELIRIVNVIQQTTNSFKSSLNPRLDSELCLIQLCRPEMAPDAKSLSARVSRLEAEFTDKLVLLEQRISTGQIAASTPQPAEEIRPVDADSPTAVPPAPNSAPRENPPDDNAWEKIRQRAAPEVETMLRPFLSQVSGTVQGDALILTPNSDMVREMLNRKDILQLLRNKASVVMGRSMRIQMNRPGTGREDRLKELAEQFGNLDNITVYP